MNYAILFMAVISGSYALMTEDDSMALLCSIFMVTALLAIYIEHGSKND